MYTVLRVAIVPQVTAGLWWVGSKYFGYISVLTVPTVLVRLIRCHVLPP